MASALRSVEKRTCENNMKQRTRMKRVSERAYRHKHPRAVRETQRAGRRLIAVNDILAAMPRDKIGRWREALRQEKERMDRVYAEAKSRDE